MKKSYLLFILFAFFSTIIVAQQDNYKWKIGLHSGGMGYVGDLNSRLINPQTQWLANPAANIRPAYGFSVEYAPGANFGLRALWSNGQFTANDRTVSFGNVLQTDAENFTRSLNARTNINDVSLTGTFYLQRKRPGKKRSFAPYIMIGAGLTQFEVFGDLFFNNDNRYYYWSDFTVRDMPEGISSEVSIILQDGDYETNLTELHTENTDYETNVGNIPIGLGFRWKLGDRLSLNFETLWHYTFTDYLDDVSGVYPINFDNPSALQSYAANPSNSQNVWRGRKEDRFNDMYSFNNISLNYSFGYGKNTRPIDEIAYGNDIRTIKETTTIVINEKGDTLKIEQQIREDDAKETARFRKLDEEKKALEEEIAMLENELEEAGELPKKPIVEIEAEQPEAPAVVIETPKVEVEDEAAAVVTIEEPKLSRRERRRLEKEAAEAIEIVIEEPQAPAVEIIEQPETPTVEVVIEPEMTMSDTQIELPETPETGDVITEPTIEIVTEGQRPPRPLRPDISLGDEEVTEVVIEVETPDVGEEMPDVEVEAEVPETRESRRERRRNRKNINKDIVIETPEEPSVQIVVGNEIKIEFPEEIEVTQPEAPVVEVEVETPETPGVEIEIETPEAPVVEVETPEMPAVEVEVETPEVPIAEIEIEAPETPIVEVETPEMPTVEVEVETPEVPIAEIEIETPKTPVVEIETPEMPAVEVEVETPEVPIAEIEIETPETPIVEVEMPEMPAVEVEVKTPEVPIAEIEIETPETPVVEVETPEMPAVEVEVKTPEVPIAEIEIETSETPVIEAETPEMPAVEVEVETPEAPEQVAIAVEAPEEVEAPKKLTRRDIRRMRRNPADVNKTVKIDSEQAEIPEVVMAEIREEAVEEVVTKTAQVPAIEVEASEEVAIEIETPKAPASRPAGTPTRKGALDPQISSPSTINFNTRDEARQAYEKFYMPFEDEAYYVSKELYTELDAIVRTMNRFPSLNVSLQGHTSEQEGISFIHQEITRKRVHYIQNYLVTKGVNLKRIQLNFFDDISNINETNKQQIDIRFSIRN